SLHLSVEARAFEPAVVLDRSGRHQKLPAVEVLPVRPGALGGGKELRERARPRVQLVDGVDNHRLQRGRFLRAAVLVPAVVGCDQVSDPPFQLARKSRNARCLLANELAGEDEVADELRSEEHTSELQSQSNLVCRLLLEKKKQ